MTHEDETEQPHYMNDADWEGYIASTKPDDGVIAPPGPLDTLHPDLRGERFYGDDFAYIEVTTHKFKSKIAHYMRLCERGLVKGVVLKRYDRAVGVYIPYTLDR
ncbi:MAG: hypothetical protein CMH27_06565 [Micavibrio sp.]|nr:hypothetical protein [Micavibrio sp.]|tara:strand:- start:472 stop:783 length:312 start_codon:yes stop_codon:yes gene_type:complete